MRTRMQCAVSLSILLWAVGLAHAQAPPTPVCSHQWIPNGSPYFGIPTTTCNANTPAYTNFTVPASENYNGYVYPYQGNDTLCTTAQATIESIPGQCGGTNNEGQVVTCMPQNPAYSSSNISGSVTATLMYESFVETGSPGNIECKFGTVVDGDTPALSASTPG